MFLSKKHATKTEGRQKSKGKAKQNKQIKWTKTGLLNARIEDSGTNRGRGHNWIRSLFFLCTFFQFCGEDRLFNSCLFLD